MTTIERPADADPTVVATPPAPLAMPSGEAAGRAVLAALAADATASEDTVEATPAGSPLEALGAAAGAAPLEATEPEVTAPPRAAPPVPTVAPAEPTVPAAGGAPSPAKAVPVRRPTPSPAPGLVLFSPRRGARRALTALAAVAAVALAVAGFLAWQDRTTTSYAVAGSLAALTLMLWSARGRASGTEVTIADGMLRIVQGTVQHRFPLTSPYPPIDVLGEPGDRGWKVLIQRKGMSPYVIHSRMVDPVQFTDAIRRFRPNA